MSWSWGRRWQGCWTQIEALLAGVFMPTVWTWAHTLGELKHGFLHKGVSRVGSFWGFWWLTDNLWCSSHCRNIIPISAFISRCSPCVCTCVQISSFLVRTQSHWIRGPPYFSVTSSWLIQLHPQYSYFQITSHSEVLEVRTSTYEFGGERWTQSNP